LDFIRAVAALLTFLGIVDFQSLHLFIGNQIHIVAHMLPERYVRSVTSLGGLPVLRRRGDFFWDESLRDTIAVP